MATGLMVRVSLEYFHGNHILGEIVIPLGVLGLLNQQLLPAKVYEREVQQFILNHIKAKTIDFV